MTDSVVVDDMHASSPRRGRLEWAVRDTLIAYMRRDADFAVETAGGAVFTDDGRAVIPVEISPDGRATATGAVTLRAHGGALTVALVGVVLEQGALWIADPVDAAATARLRLVQLGEPEPVAGGVRWASTLTAEADILFLYNYLPGAPFAPVFVFDAD